MRKGQYQGRPETAPGHQPSAAAHHHPHHRPNPQQTYGSGFNKPDSHSTTNYSKFHEDQVLFKSNGFDGPSSMANDSAVPHHGMTTQLPHSPQLRPQHYAPEYQMTATANFYRPDNRASSSFGGFSSDINPAGGVHERSIEEGSRDSRVNPLRTNTGFMAPSEQPKGQYYNPVA